jgi:hypothetical protein
MMIPRVIHQSWKTLEPPPEWRFCVESWRRHHPGWEYRMWTDEACRELVEREYPSFLSIYDAYSYDIQRFDAVRYLILHRFGGVYADLDMECLCPVDQLLTPGTFLAGREPEQHEQNGPMLCNAFMAASPGHPFLEHVVAMMRRKNPAILRHAEVLTTTGPVMLFEVLTSYAQSARVRVLEPERFYPLTAGSTAIQRVLTRARDARAIRRACRARGAYGIHYWANSWVRKLAGRLDNPTPENVPGYVFWSGLDSPGYDIGNAGRDVVELARTCSADDRALGFNTDGFLKSRIRLREEWTSIPNPNGNEGLYLKQ